MGEERYADHVRYGRVPRLTGLDPQPQDEGVFLHWHQGRVPQTAIKADLERQSPATVPVTHYFDLKRECRHCGRPFLFFAEEQRHWYEELGLPLEADAVHCQPCRKSLRELVGLRKDYDRLAGRERSPEQSLEMVGIALRLMDEGQLPRSVVPKLKGVLNQLPASERQREMLSRLS